MDLLIGHNVSNVAVISPDSSVSTFTVEYSMLENAPADPTAWTMHSDTLTVVTLGYGVVCQETSKCC